MLTLITECFVNFNPSQHAQYFTILVNYYIVKKNKNNTEHLAYYPALVCRSEHFLFIAYIIKVDVDNNVNKIIQSKGLKKKKNRKMQLANLTQDIRELLITKRRDTMYSFPITHSSHRFINITDTLEGFQPIKRILNKRKSLTAI